MGKQKKSTPCYGKSERKSSFSTEFQEKKNHFLAIFASFCSPRSDFALGTMPLILQAGLDD